MTDRIVNSGRSINVWIGLGSPGLYVTPTVNSLYVVGVAAIVVVGIPGSE
ncbi:hypothetical protein [Acidisoma sp. L85]|jgi:hypothetical protein|nr:hypothetical protein [Acidisoma sp. L85]